jgi:hypothetical protein
MMPPAAALLVPICLGVAGGGRGGDDVGRERARRVDAEVHGGVERPAGGLLEQRHDLVPDRDVGVVDDVLGHRDDRGDLLDVEVLVVPVDLGRLLQAGVTGHPVRDGQRRQDRETDLLAADGTRVKLVRTDAGWSGP